MKRPDIYTVETYERVVELREHDVKAELVSELTNLSCATINRIMIIEKAAKAGDITELANLMNGRASGFIKIAMGKYALSFNETTQQIETAPTPKKEGKKAAPDNTAQAFCQMIIVMESIAAYLKNIDDSLTQMKMTQVGLRSNVESSCQKFIEAIHVEGDIITKDHNRMIDLLGGIKQNTKKRQWQQGQEGG